MLQRHLGSTAFVLGLICISALPWSLYWVAQHNTLHETEVWGSAKADLRKGVIGGVMSRVTRVMLHRGRLDLGAWFGFQEVYLREPRAVESLEFAFLVPVGGYLSVLFDGGGEHFTHLGGFRFSADPELPHAYLETGRKRAFRMREPLELGDLADSWHRAELTFAGASVRLAIDGVIRAEHAVSPALHRRIGFRGGLRSVWVDDVRVECHPGDDGTCATFTERFDRRDLLGLGLLGSVGALLVVFGVVWRSGVRRRRRPVVPALAAVAVLGLLGWALWAVDHWWLAGRYPANVLEIPEYENPLFQPETPESTWEQRYPDRVALPRRRVLFLGGSQTWGSGASVQDDVWTRLVERGLNGADPARGTECINEARSGATTGDLLPRYRDQWLAEHQPDLVVVNVGHNDQKLFDFGENLKRFIAVSAERGVPLVFVLEPNTPESDTTVLAKKHLAMRVLAEQAAVPVLDLPAFFAVHRDDGFLWWDRVHLTSAGQELLAEEVARLLDPLPR